MPDIYSSGEYDIAGTIVGFLAPGDQLPSPGMEAGDALVGFPSNGLHTNGYSLARRIVFEEQGWDIESVHPDIGISWGDELLRVHRTYYESIRTMIHDGNVKGLAHITGGGIPGNLSLRQRRRFHPQRYRHRSSPA